jgi:hypothetical protein
MHLLAWAIMCGKKNSEEKSGRLETSLPLTEGIGKHSLTNSGNKAETIRSIWNRFDDKNSCTSKFIKWKKHDFCIPCGWSAQIRSVLPGVYLSKPGVFISPKDGVRIHKTDEARWRCESTLHEWFGLWICLWTSWYGCTLRVKQCAKFTKSWIQTYLVIDHRKFPSFAQFFHIFCFLPLFHALRSERDVEGLSLYSQELFLIALVTRWACLPTYVRAVCLRLRSWCASNV